MTALVVEFENPLNSEAPFIVQAVIDSQNRVVVQSPAFEGIYNKKAYLECMKIIGADKKEVSRHEQWIWFDMLRNIRDLHITEAPTNMAKTDLLTSLGEGIYGICDDAGQDRRFTRFRL